MPKAIRGLKNIVPENNLKLFCLLLPLLLLSSSIFCHTYYQVGVDSNFLVDDGKLYFAQSDHTLTVLNLETGEVIARKKNIRFSGTLQTFKDIITIHSYNKIAVLNKSTLEIIWQESKVYQPIFEGNTIFSYDGNGLVKARDLFTGKTHWSYDLPGALVLKVQKGKMLIFRSTRKNENIPTVALLDMITGKELLFKDVPLFSQDLNANFDGENIYLSTKHNDYNQLPTLTGYLPNLPFTLTNKLLVWDLEGNELDAMSVMDKLKRLIDQPYLQIGLSYRKTNKNTKGYEKEIYDFGNTTVSVLTPSEYYELPNQKYKVELELKSELYNWKGYLPYLKVRGKVVAMALTERFLLLGSDLGHVESVDRETGQSRWVYIFPTFRRTISYSSNGRPPTMATAAETYKRENTRKNLASGLIPNSTNKASNPRFIFDPEPSNPFKKLPLYLVIAWVGVLTPIFLSSLVIWLNKKWRWDARIPSIATLLISFAAVVMFFQYGRVSIPTALGFRVAMITPILLTLYFAFRCMKNKHWVSGGTILFIALLIGFFISFAFIRM